MHISTTQTLLLATLVVILLILTLINRTWEMQLVAGRDKTVPIAVRRVYERRKKIYGGYKNFRSGRHSGGIAFGALPYLVGLLYTPVILAVLIGFMHNDMNNGGSPIIFLLLAWPFLAWLNQLFRVVVPAIFTKN